MVVLKEHPSCFPPHKSFDGPSSLASTIVTFTCVEWKTPKTSKYFDRENPKCESTHHCRRRRRRYQFIDFRRPARPGLPLRAEMIADKPLPIKLRRRPLRPCPSRPKAAANRSGNVKSSLLVSWEVCGKLFDETVLRRPVRRRRENHDEFTRVDDIRRYENSLLHDKPCAKRIR